MHLKVMIMISSGILSVYITKRVLIKGSRRVFQWELISRITVEQGSLADVGVPDEHHIDQVHVLTAVYLCRHSK